MEPALTIRELIAQLGPHTRVVAGVLCAIPVLTFLVGTMHGPRRVGDSGWRYAYTLLVYAACLPGVFAAVLSMYTMLFVNQNMLDVDLVIYALPIVAMVVTLGIMSRRVELDDVPGFDRLSGLLVLIGIAFLAVFMLARTRVWLVFGGGFGALIALGALAFALLKWGSYMAFRGRGEPKRERPELGNLS